MLNADEEACLLEHCSPQLVPLVVTALHPAFRVSEFLSLTWESDLGGCEFAPSGPHGTGRLRQERREP